LTSVKLYLYGLKGFFLKIVASFPSHCVRMCCFKTLGMKVEKGAAIYSGCQIRSPQNIKLGKRSIVGEGALLDGRRGLVVGDDVNISSGAWLWTLHHDYNSPNFEAVGSSIEIGDRAWICSRATILPGVKIGEGAVVAAGAVVVRNVAPYKVVGGIPAKEIGEREGGMTYKLGRAIPFL